jgi:hypothetical protein
MPTAEELLRKSLDERREKHLRATEDLKAIVSEVSSAVSSVTNDKIKIVLEPLKRKEKAGPTFGIAIQIEDDSRVLKVYALSEAGYPILVYNNLAGLDQGISRGQLATNESLRENVLGLLDGPQSEVVRIIDNYLASQEED